MSVCVCLFVCFVCLFIVGVTRQCVSGLRKRERRSVSVRGELKKVRVEGKREKREKKCAKEINER